MKIPQMKARDIMEHLCAHILKLLVAAPPPACSQLHLGNVMVKPLKQADSQTRRSLETMMLRLALQHIQNIMIMQTLHILKLVTSTAGEYQKWIIEIKVLPTPQAPQATIPDRKGAETADLQSSSRTESRGVFTTLKNGFRKLEDVMSEPYDEHQVESDAMRRGDYVADLKGRIHQLESQVHAQTQTIAKLQSDLKTETQNVKDVKLSANKMAFALENKELFVGRQDSDDAILTEYRALVSQIKTWSIPFAQGPTINVNDVSREYVKEIQKVAPAILDFPQLLQTRKNLRLIVRGYVVMVMETCIFRFLLYIPRRRTQGKDVWMDGVLAQSFAEIEDSLFLRGTTSDRHLHDWRAFTTTLISKQAGPSNVGKGMEHHAAECSDQIFQVVGNWAPEENRKALYDGLHSIIFQAVKLSQTLRCQRACWSIRSVKSEDPAFQGSGRKAPSFFDECTMQGDDDEAENQQFRKIVEVLVTPALFKRGNTDGERFDTETCLERAEVKCRPAVHAPPVS
ncbi:MAG: hypothetical protein Q9228_003353 [Teloschistes exilis]